MCVCVCVLIPFVFLHTLYTNILIYSVYFICNWTQRELWSKEGQGNCFSPNVGSWEYMTCNFIFLLPSFVLFFSIFGNIFPFLFA